MGSRADDLIRGPRGRRMLYELARAADPELTSFGWDVVRSRETGGVQYISAAFGWGEPASDGPEQTVARAADVSQLAARLDDVDDCPIDATALDAALAESVSAARYWQEPDGTDAVLQDPVFDAPLHRIAAQVAEHPAAQWWWEPAPPEQLVVKWPEFDDGGRRPERFEPLRLEGAAARVEAWVQATRELEARETRRMRETHRPTAEPNVLRSGEWWSLPRFAGIWTSRLPDELGPAGLRFVEDDPGNERAATMPVRALVSAVLEITSPEDWAALCRRFPLEVTAARHDDWQRVTARAGRWVIPDWTAVAARFDGVHVSVGAYLCAATRAIPVDDETATVLAGWDPDSTAWLNEVVETTGTESIWRRDDALDPPRWRPEG